MPCGAAWTGLTSTGNTHQIPEPAQWNLENAFLSRSFREEGDRAGSDGIRFPARGPRARAKLGLEKTSRTSADVRSRIVESA
jgi:hypothetical protein